MTTFKNVKNFAKTTVISGDLNNTTNPVTFTVKAGTGSEFSASNFYVTAFNSSLYNSPEDDPNVRVGVCTARSSDDLTVLWTTAPAVVMSGSPTVFEGLVAEHIEAIQDAINDAEDNIVDLEAGRQFKVFVTVGFEDADYICDGASDNVQIQAAIDSLDATVGGTVYIKSGNYDMRSALKFGSSSVRKVKLMGDGYSKTVLTTNASASFFAMIYDYQAGLADIEICGITFDGNNVAAKGIIEMGTCTNVHIHDNEFRYSGSSISGSHWTVLIGEIDDAHVEDSASYNVVFENNYVHDNHNGTNETILPVGCRRSRFDNNIYYNNDNSAYTFNYYGYAYGSSCNNNLFYGTQNAIFILSCEGVTVCNNTIYTLTTSDNGISVASSQSVVISGNLIHTYTSGGFGGAGIMLFCYGGGFDGHTTLYSTNKYVNIIGNVFTNNYISINIGNTTSFNRNSDILVEGNTFNNNVGTATISVGKDQVDTLISKIVIRNNWFGSVNSFGVGIIHVNGYTGDTTKLNEVEIIGNHVTPSTTSGDSTGVHLSACTNITVNNNNLEGTFVSGGTGTNKFQGLNMFLENGATLKQCINNRGVNPNVPYAQGNITGAMTFNRVNGELVTATLTGNITPTMTDGVIAGDEMVLVLTQDGTGSRTSTWPSNFKKAGGSLTLSTGVGAVDVIATRWDGTYWREKSRSLNQS